MTINKFSFRYIFFVFALLSANCLQAQLEILTLSPELVKGANAVVREERQVFEVQSIGKATETYFVSTTILNEKGNQHAQFALPYSDLQKIKTVRAALYDKFGKQIRKIKEKDFQDLSGSRGSFFNDVRIKAIDLSYTDYPYRVEFEYELQHDGLLFYPVWHPQASTALAVQESLFEVILPSEMKLRYRAVNFDTEPTVANNHYQWSARSLPAYDRESYTPVAYSDAPRVYTAPYEFEIEGYSGDMSSWASFGQFINKLNEGTRELSPASIEKFQTMTADCADDWCKIKKLYAYLQETTRYVSIQLGIGSWRPMPAAAVDEQKYGDCKALSNYFCAMLDAVGIDAYYTLIFAGENYNYLQRNFPSSQFNHAVVAIPQGQDTIWAECTSQTAPLGYAGSFTGNRDALLITPEGGKLVRTPRYHADDNIQQRRTHLKLDAQGNAQATIKTVYGGLQQEYASRLAEMPEDKRKDELYRRIGLKNFDLLAHRYERKKALIPQVQETLELELPAFAGKSGKRLFISPGVIPSWSPAPPEPKERQHDIQLMPFPFIDADTTQIAIPKGYQAEYIPDAEVFESPFGKYESAFENNDGRISYYRRLQLNANIHDKEQYDALIDFCTKIKKADARRIVLVQATP